VISVHNFASNLQQEILQGMRKFKHVTAEKVSNYFFRRKSFWTANSKTLTHFFDAVASLASFQLLARRAAQADLICIQWTAAIVTSLYW